MARCDKPAGEVTHVEQGEPDACLGGGLNQRRAHGIRIAVRAASLIMVQIVKLADDGVSGQHHLGEYCAGQRQIGIRIQSSGERASDRFTVSLNARYIPRRSSSRIGRASCRERVYGTV